MKKTYVFGVVALVVLGGSLLVSTAGGERKVPPPVAACTDEALMCPDGSGVGRSGPQCTFSPCTDHDSFTGVVDSSGDVYRLLMPAPSNGNGATYVLSLDPSAAPISQSLVGKRVTVTGHFTEGNTLKLSHIEAVTGPAADVTRGEVAVGETLYVNGVKITLNDVTQDNRCPVGVQCIVKGSVTVSVTLKSDTDRETKSMNSDDKPVGFDSYLISIVGVTPAHAAGTTTDKADYKVQFKVVPTSAQ